MTDEEYIERLEYCQFPMTCCICQYRGSCELDNSKTVDLIHRLQAKTAELQKQVDELTKPLYDEDLFNLGYAIAVKDRTKEIFDKIFEVLCCFTTQGKSKEYNEGYIDCLAEVDKRLQNLAKEQFGVEVE